MDASCAEVEINLCFNRTLKPGNQGETMRASCAWVRLDKRGVCGFEIDAHDALSRHTSSHTYTHAHTHLTSDTNPPPHHSTASLSPPDCATEDTEYRLREATARPYTHARTHTHTHAHTHTHLTTGLHEATARPYTARHTDRHTDKHTDRQTDRQTDRHRHTQTHTDTHRHRHTHTHTHTHNTHHGLHEATARPFTAHPRSHFHARLYEPRPTAHPA